GNGATVGGWSDQVTVKNLTTGETLVSTTVGYDPNALGAIAAGQSRPRQLAFTLPDGPRGSGTLQVTVTADSGNGVFEYNTSGTAEANNAATTTAPSDLAPYADLQVGNLRLDPVTGLQSGVTVVVRWDDRNTGARATSGSWTDSVTIRNTTTGELLGT